MTARGGFPITNALSIDVEDYFMVSAFESFVRKSEWPNYPARLVDSTRRVLDLLDRHATRGTFFTVGWVAERNPALVREIHARGHEVGCHGFYHELVYNMTPDRFRADLRNTKRRIEDAIGVAVVGYRAPSFSLVPSTVWMLDILEEEGFAYDSSALPAPHARGGITNGLVGRFPGRVNGLAEFPLSTVAFLGRRFPFAGGGYFRLFPYALTRWAIRSIINGGQPAVIYVHPWEFDPDQPRMPVKGLNRFRHYVGLSGTHRKFDRLLSDFRWAPVRDVLAGLGLLSGDAPRSSRDPSPVRGSE